MNYLFEFFVPGLLLIATGIYFIYLVIFILGFFSPRKHFSAEKPKVSVIVAARDEEENIERCIRSLCNQTYSSAMYEVFIVNDQSKDATANIVTKLQEKYANLRLINIQNRPQNFAPKKYAITEALKNASGEIILTTDADITAEPTWIDSIVTYFSDDVGLVIGFSSIRENQTKKFFQKFEALDFLMLLTATKGSIALGVPISCSGQNLSFRKKAFDEIGGYGADNSEQSADDVLLLHLMKRSKEWKIAFAENPESYVQTDASRSLRDFLNRRIRWASMGITQFSKSINLTIMSIITSVLNCGLLLLLIALPFLTVKITQIVLVSLLVKFGLDFIVAIIGAFYYKKISWLWFFPFWFIFNMPYILIVSIFSVSGNYKWKEQKYTKGSIEK